MKVQRNSIDIFNPVYGACGMWVIPVSLNNATHGVGARQCRAPTRYTFVAVIFGISIRRFASLKYLFNTANNLELVYCQMASFAAE